MQAETKKASGARSISHCKNFDSRFFYLFEGYAESRTEVIKAIEENLLSTKFLIKHVKGISDRDFPESYYWFTYLKLLRTALSDGYDSTDEILLKNSLRENCHLFITQDQRSKSFNRYEGFDGHKFKPEKGHRLPPNLNQLLELIEPFQTRFDFLSPAKKNNETLSWIFDCYRRAIESWSCRKNPILFLEKLPLAIAQDWSQVGSYFEKEILRNFQQGDSSV